MARGAQERAGSRSDDPEPRLATPHLLAPPAPPAPPAVGPQRKDAGASQAFDPTDHAFVVDPYPRYRELQESPVLHQDAEGLWVLTRYADVQAAVRDPRLSSDPAHGDGPRAERRGRRVPLFSEGNARTMLTSDPPDHTRLRRLANRAFTPRAVERLRPWVGEMVTALLDDAVERGDGAVELMGDLAEPLPVLVICELLGVPPADQGRFKPWSSAIARLVDPDPDPAILTEAAPAVEGFVSYFSELIQERKKEPRDDLLSGLVHAQVDSDSDSDSLSVPELFAMVILLFVAGHETTTNLIGNGTLALLRHRRQFERLAHDPGLAVRATEELLRYDPPVQVTARTATEDMDLRGIPLQKGEGVVCGLAAANRDPSYVDQPDRLVIDRGEATHLSFSNGIHHCLGAPLARLEGQVVFAALARRFPSLELAATSLAYRDHFVLRGLTGLPLAIGQG